MQHRELIKLRIYEFGNKPGKLLAISIRKKQSHTFMQKIICPSQGTILEKIAKVFQEYYNRLYYLATADSKSPSKCLPKKRKDYIKSIALPTLLKIQTFGH